MTKDEGMSNTEITSSFVISSVPEVFPRAGTSAPQEGEAFGLHDYRRTAITGMRMMGDDGGLGGEKRAS